MQVGGLFKVEDGRMGEDFCRVVVVVVVVERVERGLLVREGWGDGGVGVCFDFVFGVEAFGCGGDAGGGDGEVFGFEIV